MINRFLNIYLLFCITLFSSCEKEHLGDCFKSTGAIIQESRPAQAGSFRAIDISKKVDVIIRQGAAEEITVEAGENIIGGITTRIENNTLFITNENKCNWVRSYSNPVNVYVTIPDLRQIIQNGNGRITSDGVLSLDTLYMETWNSGDIKLQLESDLIENRQHVTVGDVELTGHTRKLYVFNNGNGFCYLSGLEAKIAQVDSRGTGDTHVRVDSLLEYGILGMGNIYLYGPATASGSISGTGSLIRK